MILPYRVKFIKKHFFEFSFNKETEEEIKPDFEKFETLSSAEQYHLSSIYNWDDGAQVLKWIIESDKCDKGTATLIFWMAEPDYYFDFTDETIEEFEKEVFDLLKKIVGRFKSDNFKTSKFGFVPNKEGYKTEWKNAIGMWELPNSLKEGNKGSKPIVLG